MLKQLFQSISSKERWFIVFISLVLIVVTTAPAIYGFLVTPEDHVFTAMHFTSADDWFVYYSFINQGADGSVLFRDFFAPVAHLSVFRPFWLGVGLFAGIFNLSAPLAFHLARIALIPVFCFTAYLFLAYFFSDKVQRKFALTFLSFSSGLGILFIHRLVLTPLNYSHGSFQWPMDLWVPDLNTFLTLFTSPHFIGATILLLFIFLFTLLFVQSTQYRYSFLAGLSGLVLFSFHPFQVVKVFVIIGLFLLALMIRERKIIWHYCWHGLIFSIISAPAILYFIWLLQVDSLTLQRSLQNINPTTPFYLTLVAFGGLVFFAGLAIFHLIKTKKFKEDKNLFLIIWATAQFFIIYAPIDYQRRMSLGMNIPLAILSVIFMFYFYNLHKSYIKNKAALITVLGVLIFLPSTLFALSAELMIFSQERELSYVTQGEDDAYAWIKQNIPEDAVIFSSVKSGLTIPAFALSTVYVGHAVETPFYRQKKNEPEAFFKSDQPGNLEIEFLKARNIDYLFIGPREEALGDYHPFLKSYLHDVYSNPTVNIYKVL